MIGLRIKQGKVALLLAFGLFWTMSIQGQLNLVDPDPEILAYTTFLGQGMSFVDFDLDGWDDLTLTNASGELSFFRGGPEGFVPVDLGIAPGLGRPISLMWLDIDNDGDRDFIYSAGMPYTVFSGAGTQSASNVFINEEGVFFNRTTEWGFDVLRDRHAAGMAFHDVDLDGDLDVMVPVYALPCLGDWLSENVMLKQDEGTFVDISEASGIANGIQSSFQGAWLHLNDDALIDLLVINDAGAEVLCDVSNFAFLNDGDWTFTESAADLGLDVMMSSMSITIGDPDRDGEEEVFVTNQEVNEFYPHEHETAALFDRNANGVWQESAAEWGLDFDRWSWSASWVDLDLDGREELMVATNLFNVPGDGGEVEFYDNALFRVVSDGDSAGVVFAEDTSSWPGRERPMHCIVRGDLDGDGDPDGVGLGAGPYATIWTNEVEAEQPDRHWLTVSVCGTVSNSEAIGTKMILHSDGVAQMRTLRAGEDLFAQHSTTQFFGLGQSVTADSLEIFWPNGVRSVHVDLAADSAYQFVEAAHQIQTVFGPLSGDSIQIQLIAPPKWTGVAWNGELQLESTKWVGVGEPTSGAVLWFQGLFEVGFSVDWSEYEGPWPGCMESEAVNFDPQATVEDGSCSYENFCGDGTVWSSAQQMCVLLDSTCSLDLDGNGVIGVADVLQVLAQFGQICPDPSD